MEDKSKKYAEIAKQIEILEAERDAIKKELMAEIPPEGVKNEFVTAVWRSMKKWTYSDTVKTLEVKLKEDKVKIETQKEVEEKDGTAKFEETKQLAITVK